MVLKIKTLVVKKIFILFFIILITLRSEAQNTPIQTDRPDQTECPFIVPKNFLQAENGFLIEKLKGDLQTYAYPSILWKLGLNERFELRLITEVLSVKNMGNTSSGLAPVTIGFKSQICKEKGIIPTTAFIGHLTTSSVGTKNFRTTFAAPSFRFTMQHTLSKTFTLSYNLGAEWDGESAETIYLYTLTSGASITDKLGFYAELYGYAPEYNTADHRADGGFTYLVNNNILIDISAGFGISNSDLKNYVSLGFSYRFNTKGK